MGFNLNLSNIVQNLAVLFPRLSVDAQRISLFQAAVVKKSIELAANGQDPVEFVMASTALCAKWMDRARKFQFPKDLFSDPFKQLRVETLAFAKKYDLDPVFIGAMQ